MRCGLARCPGAKSTCFSITPVISFSHVHAVPSRLQCNAADLLSGHWVPILPSQYPGYQRKQSTWPWTTNDCCVLFFGLGDDVDFHCIDCRLVSGSHVNTQVSSQVIIEFNKSGSLSVHCKRSKHNSCDVLFVHLTAVLEPFLHKPFSCSILPLELYSPSSAIPSSHAKKTSSWFSVRPSYMVFGKKTSPRQILKYLNYYT